MSEVPPAAASSPAEVQPAEEPTGIVVGVDGSPLSIEALRWARRLAPSVGGPITALSAWQYPATWAMGAYPTLDWSPEADAKEALERALQEAFGADRPAGLTAEAVAGSAAHVLVEKSRKATLLIVGSRGLGGFMGLLLGSVSAACAEHAVCPVLVLHGTEHEARPVVSVPGAAGDQREGNDRK
ncbi:universal stress protein [Sinomonas sp. JGH33]|uniref:Universal stress protein n=1 Tax=Sinomonas terricola TaxID=3110330 RepID=A0ABU5T0P6_9MICC|nr:universal stress protein [Sinomonas sp. JGH33]MEA5453228.1 universal stress protein [Sinomonas sp. JGH33]